MKKKIEVVAAVLVDGDKYFVAKRKDSGELAKKWEFPGGKIELNETKEEALIRELKEELKIDVEILKPLMTVNHEYNSFYLTLHAYLCKKTNGKIVLTEHLDSKWITVSEMNDLDFAAADIPVIKLLEGIIIDK